VRIGRPSKIEADTVTNNNIQYNLSLSELDGYPHNVVLTGLPQHRLVTVYKEKKEIPRNDEYYSSLSHSYDDEFEDDRFTHFMPGIDLLYGYNLLNIAHYDLDARKLNFLFDHPVLVKSLYFPSFIQDSVDNKPINRNYYLVSAYDADTNNDSLINKFDLRHFYYFDQSCSTKVQLVPDDYSVVRSEYDKANDIMYIFARNDSNKNGTPDQKEPLHIFRLNLAMPAEAQRLY
jgi:hypothetical protein